MTRIELNRDWRVLQDVHHAGEELGLYAKAESFDDVHSQMSEWEPLEELQHLQLVFAPEPYFGRELRYFNQAPWWYQKTFELAAEPADRAYLTFTNVDYYCQVWLNGEYLGEHEGYSAPFRFEVADKLKYDGANLLAVKVSSPWDTEVEGGDEANRTGLVRRNLVKGTYEHSDTFVQRDVNPIGIYGSVTVELFNQAFFSGWPDISYQLDQAGSGAVLSAAAAVENLIPGKQYRIEMVLREADSAVICSRSEQEFTAAAAERKIESQLTAAAVNRWNTWDHGGAWMYTAELILSADGAVISQTEIPVAFRTAELERTVDKTVFYLNGKRLYVRGTSYFPDNYISAMTPERYLRDLLSIKAAGFNLVRVHVHTELDVFYDLCDQLGIAVIQDSEYNWTHPATDEWAERFMTVFRENIIMLKHHPAIICWIGMNEPGNIDPDGLTRERFMNENPGPKMYRDIQALDPGRPIIKGSFCEDDPYSGDSHNYRGSLSGGIYREIYGTTEKLNTEYGFDAPPCAASLKKRPRLYNRLKTLADRIPEIQEYQYKLVKYYTEHYRIQKYQPCSGYVQFMFIDLSPESFYGVYDWWGIPKKGLQALLESNMPIGIFLKYRDRLDGIYFVNDTDDPLENCTVSWTITSSSGEPVSSGSEQVSIGADALVEVKRLELDKPADGNWNVSLKVTGRDGSCLAKNSYRNVFDLADPVAGHPDRMSHELGMRLYWA